MKSKVIRVCSLVLLSVAVSTALVGCGSKSEKDTAASSTTSTSKVMKSSAKTKTSEKKSAKKSKTEASSSKDSQGQEEASAPGASSSKIKPQLEMMLKQGQMVVLLLSQTSLVKQQLIPKVTLLSQRLWLELGLVQVLKQRTLVLQLMLMATSLQRQISMSITNPIVKALQLQKLFKFLEISTFGRVAIFLPCFLVLQE